jgi:glyoxylate/hydroxypyruvate reductase
MTILLATNFAEAEYSVWVPVLRAALPSETVQRADASGVDLSTVDIALVANPPPGLLARLPNLRFIQSLWAGVDALLADATTPSHVPLARMVDPMMSQAIAETALWATLSLHRGFFDYAAQQERCCWEQLAQRRAEDVCVAVLGLGEMGRTAALRLAANGYRVSGWNTRALDVPGVRTLSGGAALSALLGEAEIVINLLPLTAATRGLFNRDLFSRMRRGASLVNLGRGGHVVEADLLAALASGPLNRAVLDVFATEPLPAGHAFWTHPRISVLPHVAALSDTRGSAQIVARNVAAFRAGTALAHLVDRSRGY